MNNLKKVNDDLINIEDFDPIFRKSGFNDIKKGALEMFEVRKRQNMHYDYSALKRGQKAPIFSVIEMEQDEIDFRSEDPRRKRIDATLKKKLELIMKMKMN